MTIDKSSQRVQRMFGEIAPRYDLLNHLLSLNVDRYWRWRAVRLAPPRDQSPILDVCTGTGDLALAYYRSGKGEIPVVGADFCEPMLQYAEGKKGRLARAAPAPLVFVRADAQQLPFQDDTFQLVTVAFGLRNVADTGRGLLEMVRVCQAGGRVVVLEFSLPSRQPIKAVYGWYFRHVLPRLGQCLARNREDAYRYLPNSVGEFPSGEALAEQMRAAGLDHVVYRPLTMGLATLYIGTKTPAGDRERDLEALHKTSGDPRTARSMLCAHVGRPAHSAVNALCARRETRAQRVRRLLLSRFSKNESAVDVARVD